MPVAHWYSSSWKTCWGDRSTRVMEQSAPRSARAAKIPAKPPPTMTTRLGVSGCVITASPFPFSLLFRDAWLGAGRIVPGNAIWQQAVGFLGSPAALGIGVHGDSVAEH